MSDNKEFYKYCCTMPSCRYAFKNGKNAAFVKGVYFTKISSEIEELEAEIANGHPHIYIDGNEKTVVSDKVDPLAALKKQAIAEYIAEQQKKAFEPERDMGNTTKTNSGTDGVQTTKSVAAVSLESLSGKK